MSEGKLKCAVLGLNDEGQLLLKAASSLNWFEILAVADRNGKIAEQVAAEYGYAAYDDYRQLITQNQLDCLFVAAATYSCDEHIRAAVKKKFNIFKLAPPARNFEECLEFVRLAEQENVKFAVANYLRFSKSYFALRKLLQQGRLDNVFLISGFSGAGGLAGPAWQSDPQLAGGGVLLHNCYQMIDQIVWDFGLPEQIYCLNTNTAGDRQQRRYRTEETAVLTLKFSDVFVGNVVTSKSCGPAEQFLRLYAEDKIVTVRDKGLLVCDGFGRVEEQLECDNEQLCCMVKLLENFALSILSPDKNKLCSSGADNLKNMAVIESAYLSARTGFPEQPGRILQMGHLEPTSI